jgi:hypothetical protein
MSEATPINPDRNATIISPDATPMGPGRMIDKVPVPIAAGHIRVYPKGKPDEILYEDKNIIVNVISSLFARLMANTLPGAGSVNAGPVPLGNLGSGGTPIGDPLYGIWGLALGTGDPSWSPDTQPVETATQTALITQVLRKQLSTVNYLNPSTLNPITQYSNVVSFQTTVNATTDSLNQVGIREMGLIGGGTLGVAPPGSDTNMLTAPYWNPALIPPGPANSVTLINYKTLPPLILPPEVDMIFEWILTF